jgi:acetyltransferase-like isoleucine patch superfamily enzyme
LKNVAGVTRKALAGEPFLWGLWLVCCRVMLRLKGLVLGFMFHASDLQLGRGTRVHGAKYISFGRGIRAKSGLWLETVPRYQEQTFQPCLTVGDNVLFSDGVHISCIDRIVIGNNVLMGSRIYIADHNHGVYRGPNPSLPSEPPALRPLGTTGPVLIGKNVWIGDNVIILGPATIGDGAIIGANSLVRGEVLPGTIVAGNPAKAIKRFTPATGCWEPV